MCTLQMANHEDNKRGKAAVYWGTNVCSHVMSLYSKTTYFFTDGIRCPFSYTVKKNFDKSTNLGLFEITWVYRGNMSNWLVSY